jgi:MOSC domain-containing protein YiiM
MDTPRLLEIQIADDKGLPMRSVPSIKAIEGIGLEGDRYATGKGAFSNSKPPRNIDRHMSLIESEAIADVRTQENIDVTFADTRRNVLTIGIRLNTLVGKQFYIGDVLVEGVELCDPCGRPGTLSGKEDVRARFKEAFENRGGLRVRVLGTGEIQQGDVIRLENEAI